MYTAMRAMDSTNKRPREQKLNQSHKETHKADESDRGLEQVHNFRLEFQECCHEP